jgi:hypothetical protein
VKWHLTNIYRKLDVECRVSAVACALRATSLAPLVGTPAAGVPAAPVPVVLSHPPELA